jgi:L-ascorbate metabolism protein UlaG (beta-lactamase superfamily)/predicted alpha/beta superfamily hydrolase
MRKSLLSLPLFLALAVIALAQPARPVDEFTTSAGPVRITMINHATMMVQGGGQVIQVDPVGAQRYGTLLPQADLVLIAHTHPDHLDAAAVERLKKAGTVVVGPEAVAKALPGTTVIRNGESRQVGRWRVEAVPAYNLTRGPAPGTFYHPKGDGNGYVLTFGDKRFYIAGDTENIPEMAALKNIEAAFLPVNLPFTMTPEEAAAAARVVRPKYVYPYHSRGSDLTIFNKALEGSGIEVRLRDWYQAGDEVASPQRGGAPGGQRGGAPGGQRGGEALGDAAQAGGPGRAGSQPAAAARPPAVVSPQVLPDQRVTFRLRAPNAKEVTITGDFWLEQGRTANLVKDDQGVWSITLGPFFPDVYSYAFSVDGTSMPDPANGVIKPGISATQSAFTVPGEQAAFLEARSVPHGEVRIVHFQSAVTGGVRRMHIYVPPGYDAAQTRYPVMYLLHGGGDDDGGWIAIGRANLILDNLIAQGKAKPMVVVMPSIWAMDPPVPADRRDANNALFATLLFQDVMPYVEKHYRVLASPAGRAFGGLSYPNILPDAWIPNIEKFNYVGFTSNGLNADRIASYEKQYPGVLDNPANVKRVSVYIGDGVNAMTFASAKYLADDLKRRGYKTVFSMTNGIHGWPWFRRYFAEFAQLAFQ